MDQPSTKINDSLSIEDFQVLKQFLIKSYSLQMQKAINGEINLQTSSDRVYLEETVIPVLLQGLMSLTKERPPKPVEYLAAFLLKNSNP